jgi:dTDP-4-amino-4,6-dideoxygalactose transaminase
MWPLGQIPIEFQRPELYQLKELGYNWEFPHQVVEIFEKKMAEFAGSKYAIAVDCDTHGIFLVLKYLNNPTKISVPKFTYMSVPMVIHHAGYEFQFDDREWEGIYQLEPLNIWDGAGRYQKGMFVGDDNFQILSFQAKKRLPIGRGGMILTDNEEAYKWLKKMCYDGRDLNKSQLDDDITEMGYHMYMTPEDAARGILIMDKLPEYTEDSYSWKSYKDLTQNSVFKI